MFRHVVIALSLFCFGSVLIAPSVAADRYGGVEIGAKGVKVAAIEIDSSSTPATLKILELDKQTVDVTLSRLKGKKFDSRLVEDTALVVKGFVEALKSELQIPDENIEVVASSGVPFADNIAELSAAIQAQTKKELSRIDAVEEATLTGISLVPVELRAKVLVVDVGSGNTKGGVFLDESGDPEKFTTLEVPYGTQTLSAAINEKLAETTGGKRSVTARTTSQELVGTSIRKQLAEHPELGERPRILFAGGSVWACVTIMKPETALNPFPTLTSAEIKAYVALINQNEGKYPEVDFSKVKDEAARVAARKDYERICGTAGDKPPVFRPEELQAGAALLQQISETLQFEKRQVRFDRKAMTAWITSRITPPEYRALLPDAFGRKLEFSDEASPAPVTATQRYGGVEIGAKGVKVAAIEIDSSSTPATLKILELDKQTVDVTLSRLKGKKFDSRLVEDTALVVKGFVEALKSELQIPDENIEVVASSGVPFADNIAELSAAIQAQTKKELSRIDAVEEATLTGISLVPVELRAKVLVVDVGSGNTKGGVFLDESGDPEKFTTLEVPYGTQTLSAAINEKLAETTGGKRSVTARTTSQELVGTSIRKQLAEHPELGERPRILFAGGSVWACVTIMKPETALNPFPTLTSAEIKAYVALINQNEGKYPEVDFSKVKDEAARVAARKDYERICGTAGDKPPVFRPEELQAGAALLQQISETLQFEKRQVRFDRKAMTAWITSRITPPEYRALLPDAFGRKLEFSDEASPAPVTATQRYGGVEIGAKGVKVAAIEIDSSSTPATLKILELDKQTVDVTLSRLKGKKFDSRLVEDTALVVKGFVEALKSELQIPDENIEVVASSGVPFADNIAELSAAIQAQTKKELSRIDAVEEATLTGISLVPVELRAKVLVVDVGSGNTKGGVFLDESGDPEKFTTLEVPYGTQTLSAAINEKLAETTGGKRSVTARTTSQELVGTSIRKQLAEHPELGERPRILFAGGSVWACVTIMKPETALNPFPTLTSAEIKAYVALINQNEGKYPEVDFSKVKDEAARVAARKDYERICGTAGDKPPVFRPEELQAGAALLQQISETLQFEKRQVRFDRKAMTAWITSRITPPEYRALLPDAFGRKLPEDDIASQQERVAVDEGKPHARPIQTPNTPMKKAEIEHPVKSNEPPTGLTMPPAELLGMLLFIPDQRIPEYVAYTPEFCMEVAIKCYNHGRYVDSLAFAKHAGNQRETPAVLYLQAINQIALKMDSDVIQTAKRLKKAGGASVEVVGPMREKLNGPRSILLMRLVYEQ